jgi:hypothetical protein
MDNHLCLDLDGADIEGDFASITFKYLTFAVKKCADSTLKDPSI